MGISKKKKKEKKRKEKEAAFFCLMNRSGRLEKKNQIERRAESIARTEAGAELDCASPFDSIRFDSSGTCGGRRFGASRRRFQRRRRRRRRGSNQRRGFHVTAKDLIGHVIEFLPYRYLSN